MKLTVKRILEVKVGLKEFDKKQIPSKLSYWLGRLEDNIDPVVNRYYKTHDDLIINKYGYKKEGSEQYFVKPENQKDFYEEIKHLQNQEEDLDLRTIRFELFEGVDASKDFFKAMGDLIEINE